MQESATIGELRVSAYTVPTDFPEADGTCAWHETTLVLVEANAAGQWGLGYTYADVSTAYLIEHALSKRVKGRDAFDIPAIWASLVHGVRNLGCSGICAMGISAVDTALWDLKARILGLPLVKLLGGARESVEAYGSGGFTSYSIGQLQDQLGGWAAQGFSSVKMKVGTSPPEDPARVRAAREAIGPNVQLFVDANGAYSRKQALTMADRFLEYGITWFEEPVPSNDLAGLRLLRERMPPGVRVAAGEYGYNLTDFSLLLDGAVDVLQADVTRCGGVTEFMRASALCAAGQVPFSAHTAPSLHTHPGCAAMPLENVEYFYDHARIEQMLFDGAIRAEKGRLRPDLTRPGNGLELKRRDAEKFAVYGGKQG